MSDRGSSPASIDEPVKEALGSHSERPTKSRSWAPQFRLSSFLSLTAIVSIGGAWWFRSAPVIQEYADGAKAYSRTDESDTPRMIGAFHLVDRDGRVMLRGQHLSGKPTGVWTSYHESGMRSSTGRVVGGVAVGPWTYWRASGRRQAVLNYVSAEQAIHTLNSPIATSGKWRQGPAEFWHANGVRMASGQFHDNRRHGSWEFWSPSGNPLASGGFFHGRRQGVWTEWSKDGEATERYYVDDVAQGDPKPINARITRLAENVRLAQPHWRHNVLLLKRYRLDALAPLIKALTSEQSAVQGQVLQAIASLGPEAVSAKPQVAKLLESPSRHVRRDAAICLFAISPNDQFEALTLLSRQLNAEPDLNSEPFEPLLQFGRISTFEKLLQDPSLVERRAFVRQLGARILVEAATSGNNRGLTKLLESLEKDADPEVVRINRLRNVYQQFDGGYF